MQIARVLKIYSVLKIKIIIFFNFKHAYSNNMNQLLEEKDALEDTDCIRIIPPRILPSTLTPTEGRRVWPRWQSSLEFQYSKWIRSIN